MEFGQKMNKRADLNKRAGLNFAHNTKKSMAVLFIRETFFTQRQADLSPMSQINISYQKIKPNFWQKISIISLNML